MICLLHVFGGKQRSTTMHLREFPNGLRGARSTSDQLIIDIGHGCTNAAVAGSGRTSHNTALYKVNRWPQPHSSSYLVGYVFFYYVVRLNLHFAREVSASDLPVVIIEIRDLA